MSAHLAVAFGDMDIQAETASRQIGRAARNLRNFRKRTGLSVAKMARATGLPQSAIQAAEDSSGHYLPFDVVEPMVPVLTRHGTTLAEILMLLVLPERLRLLRKSYKLAVRDMAKLLGHKSGSGYQHYESSARFDKAGFPEDVIIPLMREFRRAGAKKEEVMTIVPLKSFTALGKEIGDLIGTDDTTIALVRRVLAAGLSEVEPVAEAGRLVPVISSEAIKKVSMEMRATSEIKRTEDVLSQWEAEGYVAEWKRVSHPKPHGFLIDVFSRDHSQHFDLGETLEIDRADRALVDGKHYLVLKGDTLHLGRYDVARTALISDTDRSAARPKLQVLRVDKSCFVVGRVCRAIAERAFD